jgi:predicted CDP-diglyceride synthetase/phosphatidate cytidylyltransferase
MWFYVYISMTYTIIQCERYSVIIIIIIIIIIITIQFNSCLFTCKLNSSDANYKVSTRT